MAWDPMPKSGELDEYSGDPPMDAFGGALAKIAEASARAHGRLPTMHELVAGLVKALEGAPAGEIHDPAKVAARMAPLVEARPQPKVKRQRAKQGDVLAIPYAGDGKTQIYGWILAAPKKGDRGPGLGICVAILDRDVAAGDDLAEVVRSPYLLGPLHPNDREVREGLWRIVGNVAGDFEALLPRFTSTVRRDQRWVSVITDYAGDEVADTAENRARVREGSVGGAEHLPLAIRALRGNGRWLEGFGDWLAHGVRAP